MSVLSRGALSATRLLTGRLSHVVRMHVADASIVSSTGKMQIEATRSAPQSRTVQGEGHALQHRLGGGSRPRKTPRSKPLHSGRRHRAIESLSQRTVVVPLAVLGQEQDKAMQGTPVSNPAPLPTPMVHVKETRCVGNALSLHEASKCLLREVEDGLDDIVGYESGIVRLEMNLPQGATALGWLSSQVEIMKQHLSFYFRPRDESIVDPDTISESKPGGPFAFAGLGHSWMWKGEHGAEPTAALFEEISSFLDPNWPSIKCLAASRFDCERIPDAAWSEFGSFMFFIPALEYIEGHGQDTLACTLAWNQGLYDRHYVLGTGVATLDDAKIRLTELLQQMTTTSMDSESLVPDLDRHDVVCLRLFFDGVLTRLEMRNEPSAEAWHDLISSTCDRLIGVNHVGDLSGNVGTDAAMQEFFQTGDQGLDDLLMAMGMSTDIDLQNDEEESLSKVVLARKTDIQLKGTLNPHNLLKHLQERDATSYQFCLGLPSGGVFIGSTPERLYARHGQEVSSEAIAGTRPRGSKGDLEDDFMIGLELLRSPKDHVEFTLVRDWLRNALDAICSDVHTDIHKRIIRKAAVQHLYARFGGTLRNAHTDLDILKALHPTPAVCGRPQHLAKEVLAKAETFDRGYYSGPLGWISGNGAEFVVAIRSGLIQERQKGEFDVSLFAGVGTVKDSVPEAEWDELELKIRPFNKLLAPRLSPFDAPNVNCRAAALVVEELCRSGVKTFAIAPGSRSSPLVYAAATNPNCEIYPCIDERSLGFWSLGFGRATGKPAAVITSSGTAVANLLPSVIEANLSKIPLLLLTADRPSELRHTGANQTIDQVKIFGENTRYFHDIPPPSEKSPASELRGLLTMIDAAVRHSTATPAGPVHLNFQFHEPLAPSKSATATESSTEQNRVLQHWWSSGQPFSTRADQKLIVEHSHGHTFLEKLSDSGRGLLIVGELMTSEERMAAVEIANLLQWPCIVDVLSGLTIPCHTECSAFIHGSDQILSKDLNTWEALQPDVILQMGGHLTSKRLAQFLEHCRSSAPETEWVNISSDIWRDDPHHLVTHKLAISLTEACQLLRQQISVDQRNSEFLLLWKCVDRAVCGALERSFRDLETETALTEPYVSYVLSQMLPSGHGLFLGNGMPIRDMNMFGGLPHTEDNFGNSRSVLHVAANRGASGIDGVLSTSIGFAVGLKKPVTLLIGDVSFLHDSNGLSFLRSEVWPPITVVIINNRGGGVFDFLPIADTVPREMFKALWSTPQYVSIGALCQAYGVAHSLVSKTEELRGALSTAWRSHQHNVIEITTDRENNVQVHRQLLSRASAAALRAVSLKGRCSGEPEIVDLSWTEFSLPLRKPVTTGSPSMHRQGLTLCMNLKTTTGQIWKGLGEVAPLPGLHKESLADVLPQLRYLRKRLEGRRVPLDVCLLNGSLDEWLREAFGILAEDVYPSLRFGLDSALLMSLSFMQGITVRDLRSPPSTSAAATAAVTVNALLDSQTELDSALHACRDLIQQGYHTIKIKVGRNADPRKDALIVNAVSKAFRKQLTIRLDANQAWQLDDALLFAEVLDCPNLEYIEEPVSDISSLASFCGSTRLPVALDESLEEYQSLDALRPLLQQCRGSIVCCVLKPSRMGSLDKVLQMVEQCTSAGCKVVFSSAFESHVGLAMVSQLAAVADDVMHCENGREPGSVSHGLGTVQWFESSAMPPSAFDLFSSPIICPDAAGEASKSLHNSTESAVDTDERVDTRTVQTSLGTYRFAIREVQQINEAKKLPAVLFLHGFLGHSQDWLPVMHFLSHMFHCVAVDLPGHGNTVVRPKETTASQEMYEFRAVSQAIQTLISTMDISLHSIVGYSLGGRLGQHLAVQVSCPKLIVVSSFPGIEDASQRDARFRRDLSTAAALMHCPSMASFLHKWYQSSALWAEMRQHRPMYGHLIESRCTDAIPFNLAQALIGMSTGRMDPLRESLTCSNTQTVFVTGSQDSKLCSMMESLSQLDPSQFRFLYLSGCGHALVIEAGLRLAHAILESL